MVRIWLVVSTLVLVAVLSPSMVFAQQKKTVDEATCALPEDGYWSEIEEEVWASICGGIGTYINLKNFDQGETDLPCNPVEIEGDIPEHRQISPAFIKLLLTDSAYREKLPNNYLYLRCTLVTGPLDLSYLEVEPALFINDSYLSGAVNLRESRFDRSIGFDGSTFSGPLDANRLKVGGSFFLRKGKFNGVVNLLNAKVEDAVEASGGTFQENFTGDGLTVEHDLFIDDYATFHKVASVAGAKIGGNLNAGNSTFEGYFNANRVNIGNNFNLFGGKTKFLQKLSLMDAVIGKGFLADHVIFSGEFYGFNMNVGGLFDIGSSRLEEKFNLLSARISGTLAARGAEFLKDFSAERVYVGHYLNLNEKTSVKGATILSGATIVGDVNLGESSFGGRVNLDGAKVTGSLKAGKTKFAEAFNGDSLAVDGSVIFGRDTVFEQDAILRGAKIAGNLNAGGTAFNGGLNGNALNVVGSLFLRDDASVAGGVNLRNARIGDALEIQNALLEGGFDGDNLNVGTSLFLRRGTTIKGSVSLLNAIIGGDVDVTGSTFESDFDAEGAEIGKSLFLGKESVFKSDVSLVEAKVGDSIYTDGSIFFGNFNLELSHIGSSLFLRGKAQFLGDLFLKGAHFGAYLQFGASDFQKPIDLTGVVIDSELLLSSPAERHGAPMWGKDARLILRNTSTKALQAEMRAWRRTDGSWVQTDLTGFRYEMLGGIGAEDVGDGPNMADASARELVSWIELSQKDHIKHYDPQPYQQLEAALEDAGALTAAREVRFARFVHRRDVLTTPPLEKAGLWVAQYLVGYGVYPFRVVYWFLGLVVLGVVVGFASDARVPWQQGMMRRPKALAGIGAKFWYSLENALPLVEPKEAHKSLDHGRPWVEGFFHMQKILGFLLATILVGALTLLGG